MAKVILINPYAKDATGINEATVTPPLGLAYIGASLEKNGHKTQIIDAHILRINSEKITDSFAFKPDFIGISANIVTFKGAIDCAKKCKNLYPDTPLILGGPYGSSLSLKILSNTHAIDAIVVGEGENTIVDISRSIGKKNIFENINGVIYRNQDQIIQNEPRKFIENLDELPFPAYHLLPDLGGYRTRCRARPVGYIFTSRGCPFQCTFCNRSIFGSRWRPHSADRVIEEIHFLVEQYGIKQVDILDDNFTFDRARAEKILDRLIKEQFGLYLNLQNGIRIDRTDEELLRKMKKAGVFKIGFGVETANLGIQKKIKKVINLEKAVMLTETARSLGITTVGFFIIGLPGDNEESMQEMIEFLFKMNPHFANIAMCVPFPGTELFVEVKKNGDFLKNVEDGIDTGFFEGKPFFRLNSMDPKKIVAYFVKAYRKFYLRPSKILDMLNTIKSVEELKWLINASKSMLLK